jgi:hypothetical protein
MAPFHSSSSTRVHANRRAGRASARRRGRLRITPRAIGALAMGALAWLLVGCSGLLWIIAFTHDPHSMMVALAVWVLGFVGPSVLGTVAAYRLEEAAGEAIGAGDD